MSRHPQVCDMDRLYEICDKQGITVVEDCAHALGVTWRGEQLGNRARVSQQSILSCSRLSVLALVTTRRGGVHPTLRVCSQAELDVVKF